MRRGGPGATGAVKRQEPTSGGLSTWGSLVRFFREAENQRTGGGERGGCNSREAGLRRGSPDFIGESTDFAVIMKILEPPFAVGTTEFKHQIGDGG